MGYPALVYSYGWIVGLWIASYMVVPIISFGILAKRMAQLSRRTGAITLPDLLRERFGSPTVGLVASLLIMFLMSFTMVAQFKAGAAIMKTVWPRSAVEGMSPSTTPAPPASADAQAKPPAPAGIDRVFLIGLLIFSATVVGYTMVGGFLAAVWTDMFQSLLMWIGVLLLLGLTLWHFGGIEPITRAAVANTGPAFAAGPGYSPDGRAFLPPSLGLSMFFVWTFGGLGAPATLVRLMAVKDTATIRRSVFLLAVYNFMIYLPLLVIAVAARAAMPDLGKAADEAIPRMAILTTQGIWGGSLLAGLILIAPFGAVMATVSAYLVLIASGVVRDVYQRFLRPEATVGELRLLTFAVMLVVGVIAVVANLRPIQYLQAIVIFCGSSGASTFVVPAVMACYWRRGTAAGAFSAMLAGFSTCFALLMIGCLLPDPMMGPGGTNFRSYYLLGLEPVVWGLLASSTMGVSISLITQPPDPKIVAQAFD
jgi:SSS family solute:Na+ symporter/sodium/pantothenate symporter